MNDSYFPDFVDDPSTVLPSFQSIRKRTHDTLYAFGVDKSPKGSVDAPIQDLVDLINKHPSFATLSSCSGRIAVFDPVRVGGTEVEHAEHDDPTTQNDRMDSGKGSGGWLFVSHEPVDVCDMEQLFESSESNHHDGQPCTFRLEPMLLHIAAANVERGRQLMKLVLALGFRESGMVVTPSRVTVAVRSYSLALNVPMAPSGPWRLPEAYWRSLVEEANRRLQENLKRIQALYEEVEATLFQSRQPICVQPLPDLNLWGHAAVAVFGRDKGKEITDLLVVGGYGSGPLIIAEKKESPPARSDKVYRLRRHGVQWQKQWELLHTIDDTHIIDEASTNSLGIVTQQTLWGEREFAAACVLPVEPTMFCLFGGRASPTCPLDDLLLCQYNNSPHAIAQRPVDIRGELPSPRWGHTLTALSGNTNKLAVLVGGRNEASALSTIHVLSIIRQAENDSSYLLWESILPSSPLPSPRFHHSTVSSNDQVFVFGGRSSVSNLLETFSKSEADQPECFTFNALDKQKEGSTKITKGIDLQPFGLSAALLDVNATRKSLVLCGGLSHGSSHQTVQLFELQVTAESVGLYHKPIKLLSESSIDFGSMVHHICLPVCLPGHVLEIVSIGGGVQGFGFQQSYAKSHMFTLKLSEGTFDVDPLTPIDIKKRLESGSLPLHPISPVRPSVSKTSEPGLSHVLLVNKQDAKQIKNLLEASSFLDKQYRMSSVADSELIAVPVTQGCLVALESAQELEWKKFVKGCDTQVLPYRSGTFARRGL
jgi:tRNA wybutosine-synthesizing protein 3